MRPLRIRFVLQSPMVAPERPLHLDAITGFAAYAIACRAVADEPHGPGRDAAVVEAIDQLPFERATSENRDWCWKASQLQFRCWRPNSWHHYIRSFDMSGWAADCAAGVWKGKNAIPMGSGDCKAYSLLQPTMHADEAVAWCIGDPYALSAMLTSEIHSLGRSTRMGCGRLREIVVEEAPSEEADFWRKRTLPESMKDLRFPGHYRGTATVHPPYWDRSARVVAYEYDASEDATAVLAQPLASVEAVSSAS